MTNHSSHHTCFATFDYYAAARAGATTVILTPDVLMMPGSLAAHLERERVTGVVFGAGGARAAVAARQPRGARPQRPPVGALCRRDLPWASSASPPAAAVRRRGSATSTARRRSTSARYFHLTDANDATGPLPIGRPCANGTHPRRRRGAAACRERRDRRTAGAWIDGDVRLLARPRSQSPRPRSTPGSGRR